MKKEDMVCENCRFRFEHDDYVGLRCAKNAPVGCTEETTNRPLNLYCGVPVSRKFYCGEGEWLEEGEYYLNGMMCSIKTLLSYRRIDVEKQEYKDSLISRPDPS